MIDTGPWHVLSTDELRHKAEALRELIDSGTLTPRSAALQLTELAIIEQVLSRRGGKAAGPRRPAPRV